MNQNNFDQQIEAAFQRLAALEQQVRGAGDVSPEPHQTLRLELLEELSIALEELQVAGEELHAQNEALATAQQALEAERQRYRDLFEFAPDGYLVTDAAGVIQEANDTAAILLNREQKFLGGKLLVLFVAREDRQTFHSHLTRLQGAAQDRPENWELSIKPHHRSPFLADLTVAAFRDAEGRLVSLRWLIRDITKRKQTEQALHQRDQQIRLVADALPVYIAYLDSKQRYLFFNKMYEKGFGLSYTEIYGRHVQDVLGETAYQAISQYIETALSGQKVTYERPFTFKDGQTRYLQATYLPHFGEQGAVEGFFVLAHDITEHKQMEEALRRANETLEQQVAERTAELRRERDFISAVLNTAGALVIVLDTQGRMVRVNRACEQLTGYAYDELQGKRVWEMLLLPKEEVETVKATFEQLLAGHYPNKLENHWLAKDGSHHLIAWSNTVLLDAEGAVEHIIGTGIDITGQRRVEEALQKQTHDLDERVKELNCLYGISKVFEKQNLSLDQILQETIDLIPAAWQFPEITCAQLTLDDQIFRTSNYRETIWKQVSDIFVHGDRVGILEVNYLEEKPAKDEGPFLQEERNLLNNIAERLGEIVEHKQAREEIERSRRWLERIAHATPDIIFVLDIVNNRNVYTNRSILEILGYTPEEVRQIPDILQTFIAPDDLLQTGEFYRTMADAKPGEVRLLTHRTRHKDGRLRWIQNRVSPFTWDEKGNLREVIGLARDITERRQMEEALETHGRILDNMAEGVVVTGEDNIVYLTNPAFDAMFGYEPGELSGQNTSVLNFDPARTEAQITTEIIPILQTSGVWSGEFYNRKKDGSPFITAVHISQLEMPDKTFRISVQEDITRRKQMELEQAQLFKEVNTQRGQLRAITARLVETQEAERKAIARELHDQMGQNLTALDLNLNIIQRGIAEASPEVSESIQSHLNDSLALVEYVGTGIRNIMANLRPPILDDYGLVAALRWYGSQLASRVDFTITVQGDELVPRLASSVELALFRITQEALTNVTRHAQASQAKVSVETDNDAVRLVVADDGLGFEFGESVTITDRQSWGLITMAERAEVAGGKFRLETQPGQGTRVIVEVKYSQRGEE